MATKTLYVGNLPYSTTESDLLAHFSSYNASKVRIVEGRGFGFVDVDADQLDNAINEKHNSELSGRKLTVNEARPKAPGGGGGYGGGGGRDFGGDRGGYGGGGRDFGGGGGYGGGGRDRDRGGKGGRGGGRGY